MTTNEAMREAFEKWCTDNSILQLSKSGALNGYIADSTEIRWEAYQAAIAHSEASYADELRKLDARIEQLEEVVALQAGALEAVDDSSEECVGDDGELVFTVSADAIHAVRDVISATAETVQAFRDKLTEPLQKLSVTNILLRVVPGWDGSGEEVYAKTVTDVEAELSRLACLVEDYETGEKVSPYAQAVVEPLRMEVAMLRDMLHEVSVCHDRHCPGHKHVVAWSALSNTQATAQAYEQEVEQRGAVKALERALESRRCFGSAGVAEWIECELSTIRATSKKAG